MNLDELFKLRDTVQNNKQYLSHITTASFESDFDLRFTHESTKMEGNTLSIYEVKTVLVDGLTVGGKTLRDIYEVTNHARAFQYIKHLIQTGEAMTEDKVKDIHERVVQNIFQGGLYRTANVRITGASFSPPDWTRVREQMKGFIEEVQYRETHTNAIECAAFIHAEFVRIHPFADGNGRTARLLMNYELLKNNFLPISIPVDMQSRYYSSLDRYSKGKSLDSLHDFMALIYQLEAHRLMDYKKEIDHERHLKHDREL
ncbi:Fic family protein [Peptoniphilus equinus]|uniref:Fic family protein n=1 Tax=Peptoniphilus equinus TaxID=3016343 RepID=A0ABY7QR94_9FIRM|nr:Fic family protein [Peptoniphilus equinus]WBW49310.1 Fic family protein [Peptoniphilus equinus]